METSNAGRALLEAHDQGNYEVIGEGDRGGYQEDASD